MKKIFSKWYIIVPILAVLVIAITLIVCGENSVIAIKDNLELTIPQYKMLRDGGLFFKHGVDAPILGYIKRDYLPSEVSLLSLIYFLLPGFPAYISAFIIKVIIAVFSAIYFARTCLKDKYASNESAVILLAFSFGIFNTIPALNFAFASLPLIIALLIRIYETKKIKYFIFLFLSALISSFAYAGIFVLLGILIVFLTSLIKNKSFKPQLIIAFFILLFSYVLTEYRAFYLVISYKNIALPFFIGDLDFIGRPLSLLLVIFNPFIVGLIIYLIIRKLPDLAKNIICVLILMLVIMVNTDHNDFIKTVGKKLNIAAFKEELSYKEFYEEELFNKALKDIDYCGQISAAYGFLPATLEYNGIVTADGYIGSYYKSYKSDFNKASGDDSTYRLYFPNTGESLTINPDDFKYLDARFIFSDAEFDNAKEQGFKLIGEYASEITDRVLYVYQTISRYQYKEHSAIPYEEREIYEYDYDAILEACEELTKLSKDESELEESKEKIKEDYDFIYNEIINMSTAYTLASIRYNQDITDDTYKDLQSDIYDDYLDIIDEFSGGLRDIANSQYEKVLTEILSLSVIESLKEYEDMTDEEKDLNVREESLKNEYYQAAAEDFYFTYNGKEWDMDMLNEAYQDMEREEILEIYSGIYEQRAEVLGEIYLELVKIRDEKAKLEEYDNFADYSYRAIYGRDYTVKDVKNLCKEIKKVGGRYLEDISEASSSVATAGFDFSVENHRETYELLLPYMIDIDDELGDSLKYMLDNNLFDMDYSSVKPDMGYTTSMDSYGDAFIFDSPYGTYNDLYTCVHEFGHYNRNYNVTENMFEEVSNMDVSEIHSQGLEMLFSTYYKDIYGEELGKFLETNEVAAIADGIMSGTINAEFEIYVYEHPDATLRELGRKYKKIYEEYGYNVNGDNSTYYGFIDIQHLFTQPNYYISYATSGLSSYEIYSLSHKDRHEAIEKYMAITAYPSTYPYSGAMQYAGLSDIFEDGVSTRILKETSKYLEDDE